MPIQFLFTIDENLAKSTGVTAQVAHDTVLVDRYHEVEWEIVAFEESTPDNKVSGKIKALHDGSASSDATVVEWVPDDKIRANVAFNFTYDVDLSGTGTSQVMRLLVASTSGGVTVVSRRTGIPFEV